MSVLRRKLSYANVVSSLALFLSLGGVSYALSLSPGSVREVHLGEGAVSSAKIRDRAVRQRDLAPAVRRALVAAQAMADDGGNAPTGTGAGSDAARLAGPAGPIGPEGPVGPAGAKGQRGDDGEKGEKGEEGEKGDAGLPGVPGERGPQGEHGADGAQGRQGPEGPQGVAGRPGLSDVDVPAAVDKQRNAATFSFAGTMKSAIGQQPLDDIHPGSGLVEVRAGNGRTAQFTHYQYGTTIRTSGPTSNVFELFLGDEPQAGPPTLSVRGNRPGAGAQIQARDAYDNFAIGLDVTNPERPSLAIIDEEGRQPGATLAIENREPEGSIALSTRSAFGPVDWATLSPEGLMRMRGAVALGDSTVDPVRLHGTSGSGLPVADPGDLSTDLRAGDVNSAEEIAAVLAEDRETLNRVLETLRNHGLVD